MKTVVRVECKCEEEVGEEEEVAHTCALALTQPDISSCSDESIHWLWH